MQDIGAKVKKNRDHSNSEISIDLGEIVITEEMVKKFRQKDGADVEEHELNVEIKGDL